MNIRYVLFLFLFVAFLPPRSNARRMTDTLHWERGQPTMVTVHRQDANTPSQIDIKSLSLNQLELHEGEVLPSVPIEHVRTGTYRGNVLDVYRLHPHIQSGTVVQFDLSISGGTVVQDVLTFPSDQPFGMAAPPANDLAFVPSFKLTVTQPGIQQVSGNTLQDAGITFPLSPSSLHITWNGTTLALDLRGVGDGTFDVYDELRFYLPAIGDRWNRFSVIWLTIDPQRSPMRMTSRLVLPGTAPIRETALAHSHWWNPQLYDSRYNGLSGERWYHKKLVTGPGLLPADTTVIITPTLEMVNSSTMQITVMGHAITAGIHNLQIVHADTTWSGSGPWSVTQDVSSSTSLSLTLQPGTSLDGILVESARITYPVYLDIQFQSASFHGLDGRYIYQLFNVPPLRTLYDVTDPMQPGIMLMPSGANPQFEDDPERSYMLVDSTSLPQPSLTPHEPVMFPEHGDIVILAPDIFHDELAPLVAYRREQGISVALVSTQDIYDAWNWGHMSPDPLRAFLRNAAATWSSPPMFVLLVGDGSYDPKNYSGTARTTFVPPYLADVDLWIGETACETCFVQLDGDDPLDDVLPDLALGRLPVKSEEEVTAVVEKIIGYEQSPWGAWKNTVVSVADNYRDASGMPETAIDFPTLAWQSEQNYPSSMQINRLYYDPYDATNAGVPWRESHPEEARNRILLYLDRGAVVAQYTGHAHHYQWATTTPSSYLLGLNDVENLSTSKLPVVLGLTCLTSGFHQTGIRGTTLDEALVLFPTGGAIATWGSSGLGVAHGHDMLQAGFVHQMTETPTEQPRLGELTTAGYMNLFMEGECCEDALRTFMTMGDPLTLIQYVPPRSSLYIPTIQR